MIKVLQLYKDYYPVLGGIENHIRMLAEGLRPLDVDVRVLVTNTGSHTVTESIEGVPVTKTGRQLNVSSAPVSLGFFPAVRRLEQGIDIAHAHMPYPPGELAQLLFGRSRRFVATYHSDIVRQRVLGALYRPMLQLVLRATNLIAVSNPVYIQDSPFLRRHADKCRVIHFGVDPARFALTPALAEQAAVWRSRYPGQALILFVGRLRHYKGVNVLIEAMRSVSGAQALIVGIGPLEAAWRQQAADAGVADRVTFLGELSNAEVLAVLHAADVFVLPSTNRAETFGIVQIEAMACGLPVICTELGTGTSYVNRHGETGLVVPPNDAAALTAALNTLLADPALRQALGSAGRQRVATHFSVAAMLRQTLAFYQEALALPARGK
jgi:glycosyltransferase involved in cell wall biosynthesis